VSLDEQALNADAYGDCPSRSASVVEVIREAGCTKTKVNAFGICFVPPIKLM